MSVKVLRIEREGEEVTVFYRPNSLCIEELSRNPVANALAVTFLLPSEQVTVPPQDHCYQLSSGRCLSVPCTEQEIYRSAVDIARGVECVSRHALAYR